MIRDVNAGTMSKSLIMNTQTNAEKFAALTIAQSVRDLSQTCAGRYSSPNDKDAAAQALSARVAEMLLGNDYVIVPRYVIAELHKKLAELPA